MDKLLFWMTEALQSSVGVAIFAALLWGIASVLLSPCHLGTIPLVVGFVGSGKETTRGQGTRLAFAFAGGMLIAIVVLGGVVMSLGYAVRGFGAITNYLIAAILVVAGLNLMNILPLPLSGLALRGGKRKGVLAAATLGLVFGIGLSPCTFAFLAPILGVTFGAAGSHPVLGATFLLAFAVGHCGVIGFAGSSVDLVQRVLNWNERSAGFAARLKTVCGVLVLVAAGTLLYTA